jgi:3-oxoacyl-[acyl-carrier protein] reductase
MKLLASCNAIITGANQGLGLAIAEAFVLEGSSVLICARDEVKLQKAYEKILSLATQGQKVIACKTDMAVEEDVRRLMHTGCEQLGKIDILVNNAGVYGPKGPMEDLDSQEWTQAVAVNLFGVFFACKYLLPHMKQTRYGKIINLSGGGATSPLPRISAYAASKAAVVRLTETLAEECREFHIDVNAVAPGALNTRLLDEVLAAGPEAVGKNFYDKAVKQKESGGTSLDKGAALCVYLASAQSDGITGKLISAVWDPWQDLAKYKEDLQKSDIYSLRRIVPEDRGKNWGNKT